MFCKKCGKRITENSSVCENCGTAVDTSENTVTEVVEDAQDIQVTEVADITQEIHENETDSQENGEFTPECEENTETRSEVAAKKTVNKKKITIISIISVAAVLCIALVIFTFPYIKNTFARLFLSSEDYFAYVVKNNSEDASKEIAGTLDNLKKYTGSSASEGNVEVSFGREFYNVLGVVTEDVKIGGNYHSILNRVMDLSVPGLTSWIKDASVDYDIRTEKDKSQSLLDVDINGVAFGKVDLVQNDATGESYIGLPSYNEKYFYTQEATEGVTQLDVASDVLYSLPAKGLMEKLIAKYMICMAENVGDVEESGKTIYAGDYSKKVTSLVAEIDKDEMKDITDKVLDEMKADKEISKIIDEIAKNQGISREEVEKSIDNFFKNFNDYFATELKGKLSIELYVDGKGTIIGMNLSCNKFEYSDCSITKWFEIGSTTKIRYDVLTVELVGNGKLEGNNVKMNYELSAMGSKLADVKISELDYKKLKNGLFDGKINVKFDKSVATYSSLISGENSELNMIAKIINILPDAAFDADVTQNKDDEIKVILKVSHKNKLCADINILHRDCDKKSVVLPGADKCVDTSSENMWETWTETFDDRAFFKNLENAKATHVKIMDAAYRIVSCKVWGRGELDVDALFDDLEEAGVPNINIWRLAYKLFFK